MDDGVNAILGQLEAIESSGDFESLKITVRETVRRHGYDRIMMFSASATDDNLPEAIYWIEGHWFDDGEVPDAETYIRHCPVTRHVLKTDLPFFWTKTDTDKGERYRFVNSPRGPGLHGLQVPIFGRSGLVGAVSFGGGRIDSTPKARLAMTQIGVTAFIAARALLEVPRSAGDTRLSPRELEVLRWIASGRRVADIAATLGRSERTIENHLRRIRQRLQVNTTAQAISAALRSGAI